jgi:hypothetical protein
MVIFNEIKGIIIHDCSVVLALQQKNCISIVINAKILIKTENNGTAVYSFFIFILQARHQPLRMHLSLGLIVLP